MDGIAIDKPSRAGDICQIPAGLAAHFTWDVGCAVQHSIMVEFDEKLFSAYCPEIVSSLFLSGHLIPKNYARRKRLGQLIQILAGELDGATIQGNLYAETVIRLIAMELATHEWTHQPRPMMENLGSDKRIRKAVDFIEENWQRNFALRELGREAGLSLTRLIHLFKITTGETPHAYQVARRISHASKMLQTTDKAISQIALECGFSDQPHMTRAFKTRLKCTPNALRRAPGNMHRNPNVSIYAEVLLGGSAR